MLSIFLLTTCPASTYRVNESLTKKGEHEIFHVHFEEFNLHNNVVSNKVTAIITPYHIIMGPQCVGCAAMKAHAYKMFKNNFSSNAIKSVDIFHKY